MKTDMVVCEIFLDDRELHLIDTREPHAYLWSVLRLTLAYPGTEDEARRRFLGKTISIEEKG